MAELGFPLICSMLGEDEISLPVTHVKTVLVTFWDGVRSWRQVMPELLQDFKHDNIPFPHPFTVWVLSFSFCIEWGSLRVQAWSRAMNAPITNPLFPGLLSVLCVQAPLRSPQTTLLPLHSPSDLQRLPGAVSNLWAKGQWDSNVLSLTSLKREIWNKKNN